MSAPIFEEGSKNHGESSGRFTSKDYTRYIWLLQNIVFDLKATGLPAEAVQEIASWINQNVLQKAEPLKENSFPLINGIHISNTTVKTGEIVTIEINCSPELRLFIEGEHPGLCIRDEQANSFSFIAGKSSLNNFQISAVNPMTLLSSKKDMTIIVE